MQIAILLYPNLTVLDAVGPYEVLSRLPGVEVVFVGERAGEVRSDVGFLGLMVDKTLDEVPHPDVVLVPGGPGQAELMSDGPVHEWLRRVDATTTWTTSVCTGSLILAAAGLLTGRKATSYWLAVDTLSAFGATGVRQRYVRDGKYVTAAGVSAGVDMALALVDWMAGPDQAMALQLGIEYDPRPPFDAGSPDKAPRDIVELLRSRSRFERAGGSQRVALPRKL